MADQEGGTTMAEEAQPKQEDKTMEEEKGNEEEFTVDAPAKKRGRQAGSKGKKGHQEGGSQGDQGKIDQGGPQEEPHQEGGD